MKEQQRVEEDQTAHICIHIFLYTLLSNKSMVTKSTIQVNPLPNNNFLDLVKFRAFTDDKVNAAKIKISVFDREENILGKGENAGTSIFSFSQSVSKSHVFQGHKKSGWCITELI